MTKKEIAQKKEELCELHVEALKDFKNFFEEKKEKLKEKAKARKKS